MNVKDVETNKTIVELVSQLLGRPEYEHFVEFYLKMAAYHFSRGSIPEAKLCEFKSNSLADLCETIGKQGLGQVEKPVWPVSDGNALFGDPTRELEVGKFLDSKGVGCKSSKAARLTFHSVLKKYYELVRGCKPPVKSDGKTAAYTEADRGLMEDVWQRLEIIF